MALWRPVYGHVDLCTWYMALLTSVPGIWPWVLVVIMAWSWVLVVIMAWSWVLYPWVYPSPTCRTRSVHGPAGRTDVLPTLNGRGIELSLVDP